MRPLRILIAAAFLFVPALASAQSVPRDDIVGHLRIIALNHEFVRDVARANHIATFELLTANFGLDQWKPETAEKITLPLAHILPDAVRDGIVINRAEFRLYYFTPDGALAFTAPIGIGFDEYETPLGETTVVRKQKLPTWYPTESARADFPDLPAAVPPGPANPLGADALYLGWQSYLIHGTIDDYGIGRRYTRGCVRLFNEDIETLYDMVPVGTRVTVVHQPVKLGWHQNELFMEVHPDYDQLEELRVNASFTMKGGDPSVEPWIAGQAAERTGEIDWGAVREALGRRSGMPVQITNPRAHPVGITESAVSF